MKKSISMLLGFFLICEGWMPLSLFAEKIPPPAPKENKNVEETQLALSKLNIRAMTTDALKRLPDFFQGVPKDVKRISIMRLEMDDQVYLDTLRIQHEMLTAFMAAKRFTVVECRECQKFKLHIEEDTLILSRNIETTEKLKNLGKELKIDAFLFGNVKLDQVSNELRLGLKLVKSSDGTIVQSKTLVGYNSSGKIHWTIDAGRDNDFVISGPVYQKETSPSSKPTRLPLSIFRGSLLIPEIYEHPMTSEQTERLYQFLEKALQQLPMFLEQIPPQIKIITVGAIEKTQNYNLSTRKSYQMLLEALKKSSRFEIIECARCKMKQVFLEKKALVFRNSIASPEELMNLYKNNKIEALLRGTIYYDDIKGVQLGLEMVDTQSGKIIHAGKLTNKPYQKSSKWNIHLVGESSFIIEGTLANVPNTIKKIDTVIAKQNLPVSTEKKTLPPPDLDLDHILKDILSQVPGFLSDLPADIKKISFAWIEGDSEKDIKPAFIRNQIIEKILEQKKLTVIECGMCQYVKYRITPKGLTRLTLRDHLKTLKELREKFQFDALLVGQVQLDEEKGVILLTLQLIRGHTGEVARMKTLKNSPSVLIPDDSLSVSFLTSELNYTKTRYNETSEGQSDFESTRFFGINFRYHTSTYWNRINYGIDVDIYQGSAEDSKDAISIQMIYLMGHYLLPMELWGKDLLSAYAGYGIGIINANEVEQIPLKGLKLGAELRIIPGLAVGLDLYLLDNASYTNKDEDPSEQDEISASFKGNGLGLNARIHF